MVRFIPKISHGRRKKIINEKILKKIDKMCRMCKNKTVHQKTENLERLLTLGEV